jgi:hypothetical protein
MKISDAGKTAALAGVKAAQRQWAMEEIDELIECHPNSPEFNDEYLDVLGCIVKFGFIPNHRLNEIRTVIKARGLREAYTPWSQKQTDRGRKPIPFASIQRVAAFFRVAILTTWAAKDVGGLKTIDL